MKTHLKKTDLKLNTFLAGVVTVMLAQTAGAETLSMNGDGTGTADTKITEVADGHVIMVTNSTYEGFSVQDNPMATSNGVCNGTMELMAGKLSGGGHCVYTDADGDNWAISWVPEAMSQTGAVEGNWMLTGGSGKYAGATGEGTFSSLTNRETGTFVNTTTGEVTLQ